MVWLTVRRIEKCGLSFARAGEFLPGDLLIAPSSCLEKEKVLCLLVFVDELGAAAPEDLRGAMVDRVRLVDRVVVCVGKGEPTTEVLADRRFFFVGVVRRCFLSGRRVTGVHGWRVSLGMSWDGRVHVRVSSNRMELASGCALYV